MKKKKVEPKFIGGGIQVTLTKEFSEYGVTREAGQTITVDPAGYKKLKEGGFLDKEIKEKN